MAHFLAMLVIFGGVYSFFSFGFSYVYMDQKYSELKTLMIASLVASPGIILMSVASHLKQDIPKVVSESCGTVKEYAIHNKVYSLGIIDEKSGYIYYFKFDASQPRLEKQQYVCFKFYDRFRNAIGMSELIEIKTLVKKETSEIHTP